MDLAIQRSKIMNDYIDKHSKGNMAAILKMINTNLEYMANYWMTRSAKVSNDNISTILIDFRSVIEGLCTFDQSPEKGLVAIQRLEKHRNTLKKDIRIPPHNEEMKQKRELIIKYWNYLLGHFSYEKLEANNIISKENIEKLQ